MLHKPLCIGIGGVSRSGKTFLADLLQKEIPGSIVIHQDTYIPIETEIPKIKNHTDWEKPEAIDWDKFRQAIELGILSGKTVLVEGLFAFHKMEINNLYNKAIFINLSHQEFLSRKRMDLRWGKEPEWYINHVWNSYLIYGQMPEYFMNPLIINGEHNLNMAQIIQYLESQNSCSY